MEGAYNPRERRRYMATWVSFQLQFIFRSGTAHLNTATPPPFKLTFNKTIFLKAGVSTHKRLLFIPIFCVQGQAQVVLRVYLM
ncbi:hypothetical protein FKM82_026315 [Ascaphus truei]